MEIGQLKQLLIQSWNLETCAPGLKSEWNEENPSLGQCATTALIVNDFFGGKIMKCMTSSGIHYYNIIDSELVDLTVEQFLGKIPQYENGEERPRKYLLSNENIKNRYLLLNKNLQESIKKENQIRNNRFQMCVNQRLKAMMPEEVSQEFRELLHLCSNQLYLDENGLVLQKKKKL